MSQTYKKLFHTSESLERELAGHAFLKDYTTKLPAIHGTSKQHGGYTLTMDRIDMDGGQIVAEALAADKPVDMTGLFEELRGVSAGNIRYTCPSGGTQLFYLARLPRLLSPELRQYAVDFFANVMTASVSGIPVALRPSLLTDIADRVAGFDMGLSVPSLGDLHERNMATNGYMIDFEAAGWNLLASDIATFLWHTIFAGNYFGPQYAKWSNEQDKQQFISSPRQFSYGNGEVICKLSPARSSLIWQYLNTYVAKLPQVADLEADIAAAIAFRLFTVYPFQDYSESDRYMTFVLANFCLDTRLSLRARLELLVAQNPAPVAPERIPELT